MASRITFDVPDPRPAEVACKSCGAPMIWIRYETREGDTSSIPLDVNSEQTAMFGTTMESHFAHCPDADNFRRG